MNFGAFQAKQAKLSLRQWKYPLHTGSGQLCAHLYFLGPVCEHMGYLQVICVPIISWKFRGFVTVTFIQLFDSWIFFITLFARNYGIMDL